MTNRSNTVIGAALGSSCLLFSLFAVAFALPLPASISHNKGGQFLVGLLTSGALTCGLSAALKRNPTALPSLRRGVIVGYLVSALLWAATVIAA